jgi:hypothetical protein
MEPPAAVVPWSVKSLKKFRVGGDSPEVSGADPLVDTLKGVPATVMVKVMP